MGMAVILLLLISGRVIVPPDFLGQVCDLCNKQAKRVAVGHVFLGLCLAHMVTIKSCARLPNALKKSGDAI